VKCDSKQLEQDWKSRLLPIFDRQLDLVAKAKGKATKGQISRTRLSRLAGEILSFRRRIAAANFPLPSDVPLSWQCTVTPSGIRTVPVQQEAPKATETAVVSGTVASLLAEIRELESTQTNLTATQTWQTCKGVADLVMRLFHVLQDGDPDDTQTVEYEFHAISEVDSVMPVRPFDLNEAFREAGMLP